MFASLRRRLPVRRKQQHSAPRAAILKPERFAELDPDKVAAIEKSFFIGQAGMTFVLSGDCDDKSVVTIDIEQPYPYSFEANSLATILAEALEINKRSIETVKKSDVDTLAAARSGGSKLIFFSRYSSGNSS
jgi:hypothetical protein